MTEKNWATAQSGAKLVDVSHEATHVASSAANLLVEREDLLWITADAPQHVTLQVSDAHPPLNYVGWHVWHDYLTNPKTVEIASGASLDDMTAQLVCQALTGAGTQIWKLPGPIPMHHLFIRVTILETFGPGPTYLNNVVLFANDPGLRSRDVRSRVDADGSARARTTKEGTSGRMSDLLKELDEDIRALHPLKAVAPKKNMLLYVPQEPVAVLSSAVMGDAEEEKKYADIVSPPIRELEGRQGSSSSMNSTPQFANMRDVSESRAHPNSHLHNYHLQQQQQHQHQDQQHQHQQLCVPQRLDDRLSMLEQAVASLTQTMTHQREDITMIKRLLLQQATDKRRDLERQLTVSHSPPAAHQQQSQEPQQLRNHRVSRHQVAVDFPEDALRTFVEGVVAPKLHKYAKRTEAQTIAKLDEFLKDIVTEMTHAVDERVQLHMRQIAAGGSAAHEKMPSRASSRSAETGKRSGSAKDRAAYYQSRSPAFGTPSGRCGGEGGTAPVSIIHDTSTETDPMYSRRHGASTR